MSDTQALLDEALILGDLELKLLGQGEVEKAGEAAQRRGRLINEALENSSKEAVHTLLDKIKQLMALQGRLTSEARELHNSIRGELQRTHKETVRFNGYGKASRYTPMIQSRLHKRG